jgi:hypothetical protein
VNGIGCESHEKNLLNSGRRGLQLAEMIASRANVGRISAAGSDHRGLHQKFRGSKVAQQGNRVNVAGRAVASAAIFIAGA